MSHYKLKANIGGSEVIAESLELTGSKAFKIFPDSRNETEIPIRGSAVVNILGKSHSIQLNHKVKEYADPEPSTTKWSYITDMYLTGDTPVPAIDIKSQDTGYVRASRGKTTYDSQGFMTQKIIISKSYTTYSNLLSTVGDFSGTHYGEEYNKTMQYMDLFHFTMYYKYATIEDTQVIPPVDDGTPASNKARIPCRPDVSGAPDWVVNSGIGYVIDYKTSAGATPVRRFFRLWSEFIAFWDAIQTDPAYYDATFFYLWEGQVQFNELLSQRGSNTVTISEIDNGKGIGIHGAKPIYLIISQQEGRNIYGASVIPATSDMLDTRDGVWGFDDLSLAQIYNNKLSRNDAATYNYKPKFRIKSSSSYYARSIQVITGGSIITYPPNNNVTFQYQYLGLPFILRLFKENANGISKVSMRPYYKQTGTSSPNGTEFWKDSINIMGSQNFNPIKYDQWNGNFHLLHIRSGVEGEQDVGFRGLLAGPTQGDFGLLAFQLIPITLYTWTGDQLYVMDDIDGEGGVGTKGVDYVKRYTRYESAIGGADTPGQNSTDVYKAAFLKWPNADGNNEPDHISTTGVFESVPSKMGKNWEHTTQYDENGLYKYIDRVMFLPVLWTQIRLEESADLRTFLSSPKFGHYLLSPQIPDAEIDQNSEAIYRIHINGLDIQMS